MQVRSFFNNTKEIVTFVCAVRIGVLEAAVLACKCSPRRQISPQVRIGVLEAAVFSMFDSLGTFAYGVPNILATPAMFYGSNLYGQGRYHLAKHARAHHGASPFPTGTARDGTATFRACSSSTRRWPSPLRPSSSSSGFLRSPPQPPSFSPTACRCVCVHAECMLSACRVHAECMLRAR